MEVLRGTSLAEPNDTDLCERMFRLRYVRVVEHKDWTLEVEYRGKLTSAQKQYLQDKERQGWPIQIRRKATEPC